jgi:hypothetical protein
MNTEFEALLTRIDGLIADRKNHPQYYVVSLERLRDAIKPLYEKHVAQTISYNPGEKS